MNWRCGALPFVLTKTPSVKPWAVSFESKKRSSQKGATTGSANLAVGKQSLPNVVDPPDDPAPNWTFPFVLIAIRLKDAPQALIGNGRCCSPDPDLERWKRTSSAVPLTRFPEFSRENVAPPVALIE